MWLSCVGSDWCSFAPLKKSRWNHRSYVCPIYLVWISCLHKSYLVYCEHSLYNPPFISALQQYDFYTHRSQTLLLFPWALQVTWLRWCPPVWQLTATVLQLKRAAKTKTKTKKWKFLHYRKALNLPIFARGGLLVSWRIYDHWVQTVTLAMPPNQCFPRLLHQWWVHD